MYLPTAVLGLASVLVSYVIYFTLTAILTSRRHAATAREWNCLEPAIQKNALPFGIDQIRRALKADKDRRFPVDTIQRHKDVGALTYKASLLGLTNIVTADEKNIQALLATQFKDFDIGEVRRANFMPLLGNGIFTSDGKAWEHSRSMLRPQFAREQISNLVLEENHVQNLMRHLVCNPAADGWTAEVDLQELFFRLTLDSATEFLFGESVDSQRIALSSNGSFESKFFSVGIDEKAVARAFDNAQTALATRVRFQKRYWVYNPAFFRESCKICHDFIDHFVRLALSKESHKTGLERVCIKEKYVFLEALAAETQDPLVLRSQLLHVLVAGRDTTASLLGWVFFCLARSPSRYTKLRDTVMHDFGTYDNPLEITFSKLKSCIYLQQCLKETLRLYSVVPLNSRTANKDTTLPAGGGPDGTAKVFVPKGTAVNYSVHVVHHREDIWGEDVEEWKPERWVGKKPGWEYLPFGGGPRICLGQQFALTETGYVTVRLLQRFSEMENLDLNVVPAHNLTLINSSGNGVMVRLRE